MDGLRLSSTVKSAVVVAVAVHTDRAIALAVVLPSPCMLSRRRDDAARAARVESVEASVRDGPCGGGDEKDGAVQPPPLSARAAAAVRDVNEWAPRKQAPRAGPMSADGVPSADVDGPDVSWTVASWSNSFSAPDAVVPAPSAVVAVVVVVAVAAGVALDVVT